MGVKYFTKTEIHNQQTEIKAVYQKGSWITHVEKNTGRITKRIKDAYGSNAKIVELGSGAGHTLKSFIEKGFNNINGIDIDNYLIYPELKDRLLIADLNIDQLPFQDSSTDIILAFEIMEHLENPAHFERESARILKSGGLLFISVPYGHTLWDKIKFFCSGNLVNFHKNNNHITFLTRDVFFKLFFKDFNVIDTFWSTGWIPYLRPRRWNKFLPPHPWWSPKVCYVLKKK